MDLGPDGRLGDAQGRGGGGQAAAAGRFGEAAQLLEAHFFVAALRETWRHVGVSMLNGLAEAY
jgi:hypothetical protein